jgi:hypothetical protein
MNVKLNQVYVLIVKAEKIIINVKAIPKFKKKKIQGNVKTVMGLLVLTDINYVKNVPKKKMFAGFV